MVTTAKDQNNIQVSIVVPYYNEAKTLSVLLDSVVKLDREVTFELVMVDNNSSDNGSDVVKSYQSKIENLVMVTEKRQGIGQARRSGVAAARGAIIINTDADVSLPEDWVTVIYARLTARPDIVGLVGTYRFSDKGKLFNLFFRGAMIFFDWFHRLLTGSFAFRGLSFAVKKEAYLAAGGFNPTISALEDVDLSLRVKKEGKIIYCPELAVNTGYRRFEGRFWTQLFKRVKSYYYRVVLRSNQGADWDVVR